MRRHLGLWLAATLLLIDASASAVEVSDQDRFQLWNGCRPVDVLVVSLSEDAGKIGLRTEYIETTVRSRLRGARIYDGVPRHDEPGWLGWMVRHRRYGEPFLYLITYEAQPGAGHDGRSLSEGRSRARNDGRSGRKGRHAAA